jgi:tRNA (guanine-N7-)-methyltransferase
MRRRLRQHVNPLKASNLVARGAPLPIADDRPLEVELGCGDALFLLDRAEHLPDRLFVGLDIREKFLADAREELARRALPNLWLYESNLIVDLPQLFAPERVQRFHINFPDPWFKRRQRNRRWLSAETVPFLTASLEPGGEIFFQSDVWDLSLEALSLFESSSLLQNTADEWRFLRQSPYSEQSARERGCLEEGRSIWRLLFRRAAAGMTP